MHVLKKKSILKIACKRDYKVFEILSTHDLIVLTRRKELNILYGWKLISKIFTGWLALHLACLVANNLEP